MPVSDKLYCFSFKSRRRGIIFLQTREPYDQAKLFRGEIEIETKFKTFICKGTTYCPYAFLPDPHNIAISEKFRNTLIQNKITGFKCYEIEIENSKFKY